MSEVARLVGMERRSYEKDGQRSEERRVGKECM